MKNPLTKSPIFDNGPGFDTAKYFEKQQRRSLLRDQFLGLDLGSSSSESILNRTYANTPLRVNLGLERRPQREGRTGVARGLYTTAHGLVNTVEELSGNDGPGTLSYGMDRWARTHQGTFVGQPAYEGHCRLVCWE